MSVAYAKLITTKKGKLMKQDLIQEIVDEMTKVYNLTETEALVAKVAMQNLAFKMRFGK